MFKLQNPLTNHESPDELNWLLLDSERVIGPTAYGTVSIGKAKKNQRYGVRLLVCAQTRSLVESFSKHGLLVVDVSYYSTTTSARLVNQ